MASSLYQNKKKAVYLPEEVCVEILKRVEVVSLLRFRCVCKSWNSIISSSSFFNNHYLSFTCNKSYFLFYSLRNSFRFRSVCKSWSSYAIYNPQDYQSPPCDEDLGIVRIPFPPKQLHLIDVVHGVVCLLQRRQPIPTPSTDPESLILWNPTIHKHVETHLTYSQHPSDIGFGFDASKNDFKAVRFIHSYPRKFEVFSAREGRWKSLAADLIDPLPPGPKLSASCFMNGSIHWIVHSYFTKMEVMLVFDCEREEFKTMEFPPELNRLRYANLRNTYCGMLSVQWLDREGVEEMWVMEEYGVVSSWKKLEPNKMVNDFVVRSVEQQQRLRVVITSLDDGSIKGVHDTAPIHYVFKPSMFLMDAEKRTM